MSYPGAAAAFANPSATMRSACRSPRPPAGPGTPRRVSTPGSRPASGSSWSTGWARSPTRRSPAGTRARPSPTPPANPARARKEARWQPLALRARPPRRRLLRRARRGRRRRALLLGGPGPHPRGRRARARRPDRGLHRVRGGGGATYRLNSKKPASSSAATRCRSAACRWGRSRTSNSPTTTKRMITIHIEGGLVPLHREPSPRCGCPR